MRVPMPLRMVAVLGLTAVIFAITPLLVAAQSVEGSKLALADAPEVAIGDSIQLQASLTSGGIPVPGVEIVFFRAVEFLNSGNDLLIGRAMTDESGIAAVDFAPRSEGEILILAEFGGTEAVGDAFTEGSVLVGPGPPQYLVEAGIGVPGINVYLLAGVLTTVWGTFFFVMTLVWRIARDGFVDASPKNSHGRGHR